VETHPPDPTSEEQADPWDRVSSEFSTLGERLKDTYRRVSSEGGPSEEEIRGAFATLTGVWDQVASSFSTALSDPETRAHLKKAASSFAAALGATLTDLGDEIKGGRADGSVPPDVSGDETVDERRTGGGVVDGDREPHPVAEGHR
jgi:hypothetical protein